MENIEKKEEIKQKRNTSRKPIKLVVEREFIGTKNVSEMFIPIILDDIQKNTEKIRTLDNSTGNG